MRCGYEPGAAATMVPILPTQYNNRYQMIRAGPLPASFSEVTEARLVKV